MLLQCDVFGTVVKYKSSSRWEKP